MPAEDCAAGFAYGIVHARDYHGQITDAFRPLSMAGLIHVQHHHRGRLRPAIAICSTNTRGRSCPGADAVQLSQELQEIMQESSAKQTSSACFSGHGLPACSTQNWVDGG